MTMKQVKRVLGSAGESAIHVVDRVGPRRGLIGLGILVAAVGGTLLAVRLVRNRRAAVDLEDTGVEGFDAGDLAGEHGRRRGRNARRGGHAQSAVR